MADLVRHAVGVDLVEVQLRHGARRGAARRARAPAASASRSRSASSPPRPGRCRPGRVVRVGSLEQVLAFPGVVQADTYLAEGETIRPVRLDGDRRGYVIAIADTNLEALERAEAAARAASTWRSSRHELRLLARRTTASCSRRRRPAATGSPASTARRSAGDLILRHDVDLSLEAARRGGRGRGRGGRVVDVVPDDAVGLLQPRLGRGRARDRAAARARRPRRATTRSGPHVDLDDRFDPVVAWHNPDPEYMTRADRGRRQRDERAVVRPRALPLRLEPALAPRLPARASSRAASFEWLQLLTHPEIWAYDGATMGETMRVVPRRRPRRAPRAPRADRIDLA